MKNNIGPERIKDLFGKQQPAKKPPAYQWQEFALKIINELDVPSIKRSSVFLVCKKYPKNFIEKCFNDTKELCKTDDKWKYFFKLTSKE